MICGVGHSWLIEQINTFSFESLQSRFFNTYTRGSFIGTKGYPVNNDILIISDPKLVWVLSDKRTLKAPTLGKCSIAFSTLSYR